MWEYNNPTIHNPRSPMNFIRRVLNFPKNKPMLGRWQLHYDPQTVNSKIDQANEDHCGCCNEPTPPPIKPPPFQSPQPKPSDEYYVPYVVSSFH